MQGGPPLHSLKKRRKQSTVLKVRDVYIYDYALSALRPPQPSRNGRESCISPERHAATGELSISAFGAAYGSIRDMQLLLF